MGIEHVIQAKLLINEALEAGREIAKREGKGLHVWDTWDSSVESYQDSFSLVLPEDFSSLLNERRKTKIVCVLDLMSTPAMLTGLDIDGGLAVSLGNIPLQKYERKMAEKNIGFISGNLLLRRTWNNIHNWLKSNNYQGFDLITCRADMLSVHNYYIPGNETVYYSLLDRVWELLDRNGGIFLVGGPLLSVRNVSKEIVNEWLKKLEQSGIKYDYLQGTAFKLEKKPNSPEHLPTLT